MAKIGLTYTSDVKGQELTPEFKTFDQITFLGAHPRQHRINGTVCYVGAPKKEILYQTMAWTRTNDADTLEKAEECMMMSSLWGKEFFNDFCTRTQNGFRKAGIDPPENTRN